MGRKTKRTPAHGERIGRLTVTRVDGGRAVVTCACGRERVVFNSSLFGENRRTTCGARCPLGVLQEHEPKAWNDERRATLILNSVTRNARKRGLPCALSLDEVLRVRVGRACHYCGGSIKDLTPGLDRIDNERGYEDGNVVACCTLCNWARGGLLTYDEFTAAMAVRVARTGPGNAWPSAADREQRRTDKGRETLRRARLSGRNHEDSTR